jgi:hypothetical protein
MLFVVVFVLEPEALEDLQRLPGRYVRNQSELSLLHIVRDPRSLECCTLAPQVASVYYISIYAKTSQYVPPL